MASRMQPARSAQGECPIGRRSSRSEMLTSSSEHLGIALFLGESEMITPTPPLDHLKSEKTDKHFAGQAA
jgi:hypothetical protein